MASRLKLQKTLESLMDNRDVYFQPPASNKMSYPAIRYSLKDIDKKEANDLPYMQTKAYELILIDSNPDSKFVDKLSSMSKCSFDRHYVSDNLHHYVFTLYY